MIDDPTLRQPNFEENCYNCKHLVLSSSDIAHTRLDHTAKVKMECNIRPENNRKQATHRYLIAACGEWRKI